MKKTLVISISSSAVFRNLFFFPGSFFDLLKSRLATDPTLYVVFFMPLQFREKYTPFLSEKLASVSDRYAIEDVEVPTKKTRLQKLFYFFYSYLIYTGTTRIMATIGLRPDEPPAGGRWYLAPFKRLISVVFGHLPILKRRIVPFLHLKIFKERPFFALLDKYKPNAVFATHLYGWFDTMLIAEAKRRGIKTVGMPAGWDHLDKYFLPFHTDILVVQSEQIKDMAIRYQEYCPDGVITTGYPHFDFISKQDYVISRDELLQSLNFPKGAHIVLYVSGSAYCPDEPEIIETMLKWFDEGKFGKDMRLVIRPYQGGRGKDKEFDEQKFNRFESHPRVAFYRKEFWGDLEKSIYFMNIIYHADAIISIYSTAVLEAAVLDRPLIALGFDGYEDRPFERSITRFESFDHFKDVLKTGALNIPRNFNQLFTAIKSYSDTPSLDREKREQLRRTVCHTLDGNASKRVLESVLSILSKQETL